MTAINVLGSTYTVRCMSEAENPLLKGCDGYTDKTTRQIVVASASPDWFMDALTDNRAVLHGTSSGFYRAYDTTAEIETLEGRMHAEYGDYIILGVKGEIYPCKPDVFRAVYEAVRDDEP